MKRTPTSALLVDQFLRGFSMAQLARKWSIPAWKIEERIRRWWVTQDRKRKP